MADKRQPVAPDSLLTDNFSPLIRQFRAFLGNDRIAQAQEVVVQRTADGNRFRELLLRRKLPWPYAFDQYDKATLNGARPLRALTAPQEVWLAAMAGLALSRVGNTFSKSVGDGMRDRLLDLDGKVWPVLMEWDTAHFYLRHRHRLTWTERGIPGPEFRCEKDGLHFDVECKHVGQHVAEKTGDRTALSICHAVVRACDAARVGGELSIETSLTHEPVDEDALVAQIQSALAQHQDGTPIQLQGIGVLSGTFRHLGDNPRAGVVQRLEREILALPPGLRFCATSLPVGSLEPRDHVLLTVHGPQHSRQEVFEHMERELMGGGKQFPSDVPGVLIMTREGIRNLREFEAVEYQDVSTRVFQAFPVVAAVVWRCRRELNAQRGVVEQWGMAYRNRECAFPDAGRIVLND